MSHTYKLVFALFSLLVLLISGCATPLAVGTQGAVLNIPVPQDTETIFIAYKKNKFPAGMQLINVPDKDVHVLFVTDASDGDPKFYDESGNTPKSCKHCPPGRLRDDGQGNLYCDKNGLADTICDAFDFDGSNGKKKTVIPQHFDIYTSYGSCVKQYCASPNYCMYVPC